MSTHTEPQRKKRLMLLLSPNTYRAGAFLEAAQRLDVEIVRCVDVPTGLDEYWDLPLAVDFTDVEGAAAKIVEFCQAAPVDAVLAVDDSATLVAVRAAEALGLPHNPVAAAEAARDKGLMRALFAEFGVPSTNFRRFPLTADPAEIAAQVTFPCVVKPLRLSGSRGVIRADNPAELAAAFRRLKRLLLNDGFPEETTDMLVEDFIPGGEVALEGLLTSGRLHVLALFDKPDPLDGPFFEETIYVTPSRLPEATQRAIGDVAEAAARAIGLRDGPVHAELRVSPDGPRMLEIAGRSIGGLCSTILEFGAGMCLEELIVRHALELGVPSFERTGQAAGVMMIPIPRGGLLKAVHGVEEAQAVPHVTGVEISVKLNNPVVPLPEGASYLGFIFARAETPAEVEAALRAAHGKLHFEIKPLLAMA
ncbi:MAG TPA: ATP-grasp domain-containing protein [Ktedonobacterales bacterium]|nr:ATP-grasp domain-containing protein [Ktedonobacterales bacterium]